MTRLSIVLLLAVVASAMYLVHVEYEARQLFTALERERAEAHRLEVERERLEVEQRAQATPLRVEQLAQTRLGMVPATPAITQYVGYPDRPAPAAASASAARAARPAAKPSAPRKAGTR